MSFISIFNFFQSEWKKREEGFGGILFSEKLGATVFVNRKFMEGLGIKESPLWKEEKSFLSAPIFAHFQLTNRCPKQCPFCYTDSKPDGEEGLALSEIKEIIDKLSQMKVFSIAFGGGEPFSRKDIFEIAEYAREKGITPTVTTNGFFINSQNAKDCQVFNVIHVSVNFLENSSIEKTSWHQAITLLKKARVRVGINFIVSRQSYPFLEKVCQYAKAQKIKDVLFLRLKPKGRGKNFYSQSKLSNQENINLFPLLKKLAKKYKIYPMLDCSFLPIFYYHRPKRKFLGFFGLDGCVGGNYFIEIDFRGRVRSCSFCQGFAGEAREIDKLWSDSPHFLSFREWTKNAPLPCRNCEFLENCKGGCHALTQELTGDFYQPDPECPFVIEFRKKNIKTF
jgi:radical SAM protein with 4Fe4S-binding SPASM domain